MATHAQTARHKRAFLRAFAEYGNVTTAARLAHVERRRVYDWQEQDDEFAVAYREAEIRATEMLEAEARRRAVEGVSSTVPVIYQGRVIETVTEIKYSDTLLIFLLKARAPEKYRERHDITSGGQPFAAAHADLDDAIERRLALLAAGGEGAGSVAVGDDRPPEAADSAR